MNDLKYTVALWLLLSWNIPQAKGADEPVNANAEPELIWSLKPLSKPALPPTRNRTWAKTPVDSFILAKLEEQGMKPSPPADKKTLLRRVTFDLTGLPPTQAESEAFLKDKSGNAFEKVVDRLLAGPRYGERWARHWLDVVHYADTHGHSQDRPRTNAWPYRDYVIRSFNEDKPYARFVQEQLAGDVLFPNDPQGIVALGFIAAGPWDDSSQVYITEDSFDKRQAQNLDRDDMVATAMSSFVSTTVHCARCHNHKFDPIPQKEYYGLQAVFAGIDRVDRPYDLDPETNLLRQALLKRKTALDADPTGKQLLEPALQAEVAMWEKETGYAAIDWHILEPHSLISEGGTTLIKQADSSVLASGARPDTDSYTVTALTGLTNITAVRLEVLADDSLPLKGPGRQDNGNLTLTEFRASAAAASAPDSTNAVALQNPSADFDEKYAGVDYDISKALDGDSKTGWGIYPEIGRSHFAIFELKENAGFANGTILKFVLDQKMGRAHLIGKFRLSVTTAQRPVKVQKFPENIAKIFAIEPAARSDDQKIELAAYFLKTKISREIAQLPPPHMVYAVANDFEPRLIFKPPRAPRPIYVLKRGDINKPEDPVLPGALSFIPGLPPSFDLGDPEDESARRAVLAKWITDPRNVLTWRSIANRVWHYHFGRGIVDSPNDFGQMGSRPSHPELLDWLAVSFLESGGSIKRLHKLIVMSAVYQQSARENEQYAMLDSDNRLLWRMNRSRLDAEEVRDTILQITGKLDLRMGGPADMQFKLDDPNPPVTPVVDYSKFDPDSPAGVRRSIYRFIFRTIPDPFMDTLDCPDASQLTPVRNVSMTSLQALAMLNNQFILRQSQELARQIGKVNGNLDTQVREVYKRILARAPTRTELSDMKRYVSQHGLANVCRILLNCNEFIFVD
jgi:hypothetical protein